MKKRLAVFVLLLSCFVSHGMVSNREKSEARDFGVLFANSNSDCCDVSADKSLRADPEGRVNFSLKNTTKEKVIINVTVMKLRNNRYEKDDSSYNAPRDGNAVNSGDTLEVQLIPPVCVNSTDKFLAVFTFTSAQSNRVIKTKSFPFCSAVDQLPNSCADKKYEIVMHDGIMQVTPCCSQITN